MKEKGDVSPYCQQIIDHVNQRLKEFKSIKKAVDREQYNHLKEQIDEYNEEKNQKEDVKKNRLPKIVQQEEELNDVERKKVNYAFINDRLRQNLTKAFKSFIPSVHLENINHDNDADREGKK